MSAPGSPAAGAPKLVNLYNVRTVGTAKACYICSKETTTCLANSDVSDFLYSCTSHLNDRGFATAAPSSSPASPSVSQSEIDAVTAAYTAKQAAKTAPPSTDKDEKKGWLASSVSAATSIGSAALSTASSTASTLFPPPPPAATPPAVVIPKQVVLHRDVFRMRADEKKKVWQKAEARKRLEGLQLPSAPRGMPVKK